MIGSQKQEVITTQGQTLLDALKRNPDGVRVIDHRIPSNQVVWKLPTETMDAHNALVWMIAERVMIKTVMDGIYHADLFGFAIQSMPVLKQISDECGYRIKGDDSEDDVHEGVRIIQQFADHNGNFAEISALRFLSYLDPRIGPTIKIDARWYRWKTLSSSSAASIWKLPHRSRSSARTITSRSPPC